MLFVKGDLQFSRASVDRRVAVHRPSSEFAEEYDVIPTVLLCHGSHVLYPLHVHGECSEYSDKLGIRKFKELHCSTGLNGNIILCRTVTSPTATYGLALL